MDQITATAQPVVSVDPTTPTSKPHPAFRKLFLFLLLAVFVSAGATAYILMGGVTPKVVPTPQPLQTNQENPFNETVTTEANPFNETASEQTVAANPFADESSSQNPFDVFDTDTTEVTQENYENPF